MSPLLAVPLILLVWIVIGIPAVFFCGKFIAVGSREPLGIHRPGSAPEVLEDCDDE